MRCVKMGLSIEEQAEKIKQQIAELEEETKKKKAALTEQLKRKKVILNTKKRKERTKRLIQLGAIVEKYIGKIEPEEFDKNFVIVDLSKADNEQFKFALENYKAAQLITPEEAERKEKR